MTHTTIAISLSLAMTIATLGTIGFPAAALAEKDNKVYPATNCQTIQSEEYAIQFKPDGGAYNGSSDHYIDIQCPLPQDLIKASGKIFIQALHNFSPTEAQLPSGIWGCHQLNIYDRNGDHLATDRMLFQSVYNKETTVVSLPHEAPYKTYTMDCRIPRIGPDGGAAKGVIQFYVKEKDS